MEWIATDGLAQFSSLRAAGPPLKVVWMPGEHPFVMVMPGIRRSIFTRDGTLDPPGRLRVLDWLPDAEELISPSLQGTVGPVAVSGHISKTVTGFAGVSHTSRATMNAGARVVMLYRANKLQNVNGLPDTISLAALGGIASSRRQYAWQSLGGGVD